MMFFTVLITTFVAFLTIALFISRRKFNYWRNKGVPHLEPKVLFGNYQDLLLQRKCFAETVDAICKRFPEAPMVGAYIGTEPVLLVQDPELIRLVTTKDFYYFSSRETSEHSHKEVITKNLFFTFGDRWRVLRQNLTPMFSPAKMKNMFHLIEKSTVNFSRMLEEETAASSIMEVNSLMARFTMDTICSCSFGIDTKAMDKDIDNNPFRKIAYAIFRRSPYVTFLEHFRLTWPGIFYGLRFKLFPDQIINFFKTIVLNVMQERGGKPSIRQDFLDLMMEMKSQAYIKGDSMKSYKDPSMEMARLKADDELVIGNSQELFATGFETSANTLTFAMYELAKDQNIQKKVLTEVDDYFKTRDVLGFDCCSELPYLKQCVEETLRLYPVLGVVYRQVYEDYTLRGVSLERGLRVHIPVYYMHRNPKYFDNPEEFRPERFSTEARKQILPYTYMPFGEGPRYCLGTRFAWMQMMAGLATVLKSYRMELADDMPRTIKLNPRSTVTQPLDGVRLKLIKRES